MYTLLLFTLFLFIVALYTVSNEHYQLSNKFLFKAGPLTNVECRRYCSDRYLKCTQTGGNEYSGVCKRLFNECTEDCNWNQLFAKK